MEYIYVPPSPLPHTPSSLKGSAGHQDGTLGSLLRLLHKRIGKSWR